MKHYDWIVVHSQSKSAWNVISKKLGGKFKIARFPYLLVGDEKCQNIQRQEAFEHATAVVEAVAKPKRKSQNAYIQGLSASSTFMEMMVDAIDKELVKDMMDFANKKNEIVVTVSGANNTGKSTIAIAMANYFGRNGVEQVLLIDDGEPIQKENWQNSKEVHKLPNILKKINMCIDVIPTKRKI